MGLLPGVFLLLHLLLLGLLHVLHLLGLLVALLRLLHLLHLLVRHFVALALLGDVLGLHALGGLFVHLRGLAWSPTVRLELLVVEFLLLRALLELLVHELVELLLLLLVFPR